MSKGTRLPLVEAEVLARRLSRLLNEYNIRHTICGSLRRGTKPTIGDIDVVVDNLDAACIALGWGRCPENRRIMNIPFGKLVLNLYVASPKEWGAMTLFLTGNKWFNVLTRACAKKRGLKLNQYGLWDGDKRLAGASEEDIFTAMGMRIVSPSEREK